MSSAVTRLLPLLAVLPACALGGGDDGSSIAQAISGTASINLGSSSATVTLTSDAQWSLTKTGSLSGNTVTWTITATKTATISGQLVVQGQMTVANSGSGPATIGNIVANLQTRVNNNWKTAASDIADATHGDDATTAKIHAAASSEGKGSFSESTGSGKLEFMDATNNTVFSLVPEVTIGAGQSRALLFQATYNNNVLHLATGTAIRAEVIVSFGNATASGNSTANVDINGNGQIDWDEARVRSVPTRLGMTVPAQTAGNATPTLSDALGDISTTGTATHGSVWFNLGATSGTVSTTVDGGASGGTITNCAHLTTPGQTITSGGFTFTQVGALNLKSCSQVDVAAQTACVPGDAVCRWHTGDLSTRTQLGWDGTTSWYTDYNSVYASTFSTLEIGIPGTTGFSMQFGSASSISAYIPTSGAPAALNADLADPTSSSSGQFGGDVLTLQLNVDFSAAGKLAATSGLALGNLRLCNMSDATLNGTTVAGLLANANILLGGGSTGYAISDLHTILLELNAAFNAGTPSAYANDHLYSTACP